MYIPLHCDYWLRGRTSPIDAHHHEPTTAARGHGEGVDPRAKTAKTSNARFFKSHCRHFHSQFFRKGCRTCKNHNQKPEGMGGTN